MPDDRTHQTMTLRMTVANFRLLDRIASSLGMTKTAAIVNALRAYAKAEGVKVEEDGDKVTS